LVYDEFKKWLVEMDMERPPYIQSKKGVFLGSFFTLKIKTKLHMVY